MFTFGPFRLDTAQRQLFRDGTPVALPAKALDTLALLVRERGRLVEKDEILSGVWPDAFVSEDSLTHVISLLRRTLGDDSSNPVYIATIPRRGYRFLAGVSEATAAPAPVVNPPSGAATAPRSSSAAAHWSSSAAAWLTLLKPVRWAIAMVAVLAVVASTWSGTRPEEPAPEPIRFTQTAPTGSALSSGGVLSPDGRHLAFVAQNTQTGRTFLWIRSLESPTPRMLGSTDGAYRPFWSPDSRTLGFFADGKLKRVGINGVAPQTLAAVGYRPSGGSWSSRGVIVYADRLSQLFSVPDNGGVPVPVTALDRSLGEYGHHAPWFLPDGDHFLFATSNTNPEKSAVYVGSLSSPERTRVLDGGAMNPVYAAPGYLLYLRDNVLMAQAFDVDALRTTGVAARVPTRDPASQEDSDIRVGAVSASTNGRLTFGGELPTNRLTWFARDGRELGPINAPADMHNPVVSPDGRALVADGSPQGGVWLIDLERGAPTRLAPDGILGAWSHDGASVGYTSRREAAASSIFTRPANGTDAETLLIRSNEMNISGNWSSDGRYFTYVGSNPSSRLDLWVLDASSKGVPRPFLKSPANEMQPRVSPDGRWLAYASDESGTWEVYVQSFPEAGQKQTLSVGGGAQPEWRRDGRELFYLSRDGTLMVVDVSTGAIFEAGRPQPLFPLPIAGDVIGYRNQYAVAPDGQRFVVDAAGPRDPIQIVVNWHGLITQ
jgi:DNA-binding winged helix-turn-helix (wHTH) protein/Tol biopolymer transport system component